MVSTKLEMPEENPIDKIAASVYPAFALLAGMKLDLFTSLKEGPMEVEQIASIIGVNPSKLNALLYSLVVAGFLKVDGQFFSNTKRTATQPHRKPSSIVRRFIAPSPLAGSLFLRDRRPVRWNQRCRSRFLRHRNQQGLQNHPCQTQPARYSQKKIPIAQHKIPEPRL